MPLFPFMPESPMSETLRFYTDIMEHIDGSEQRVNLRKTPRQEFDLTFLVEDDDRMRIENILFGAQTQDIDLPIWSEPLFLIEPAAASDTTVVVYDPANLPSDLGYTTAYNDFRSGFSAFVWQDEDHYDKVDGLDISIPGEISFNNGLTFDYPIGTKVYPIRSTVIKQAPTVSRSAVHLTEYGIKFCVTDNDIDIADDSAFDSFNSLPLINDANAISGELKEAWDQQITVIDGRTGKFQTTSLWDRSRRNSYKTWVTSSRQRLWEVRQLLHSLRGRQKPFYLPTFYPDMEASQDLVSGTPNLVVFDRGYTNYTNSRAPRDVVRVALNSGVVYIRTVLSSSPSSATEETLVLDANWPGNIDKDDIVRIDILEKVRIDAEDIEIRHNNALGSAEVGFPVKTVLE